MILHATLHATEQIRSSETGAKERSIVKLYFIFEVDSPLKLQSKVPLKAIKLDQIQSLKRAHGAISLCK